MLLRNCRGSAVVLLDQLHAAHLGYLALDCGGLGRAEVTNRVRVMTSGKAGTFSLHCENTDYMSSSISSRHKYWFNHLIDQDYSWSHLGV